MFCAYCGTELKEGSRFCSACGRPTVEQTGANNSGTISTGDSAAQADANQAERAKSLAIIAALAIALVACAALVVALVMLPASPRNDVAATSESSVSTQAAPEEAQTSQPEGQASQDSEPSALDDDQAASERASAQAAIDNAVARGLQVLEGTVRDAAEVGYPTEQRWYVLDFAQQTKVAGMQMGSGPNPVAFNVDGLQLIDKSIDWANYNGRQITVAVDSQNVQMPTGQYIMNRIDAIGNVIELISE